MSEEGGTDQVEHRLQDSVRRPHCHYDASSQPIYCVHHISQYPKILVVEWAHQSVA